MNNDDNKYEFYSYITFRINDSVNDICLVNWLEENDIKFKIRSSGNKNSAVISYIDLLSKSGLVLENLYKEVINKRKKVINIHQKTKDSECIIELNDHPDSIDDSKDGNYLLRPIINDFLFKNSTVYININLLKPGIEMKISDAEFGIYNETFYKISNLTINDLNFSYYNTFIFTVALKFGLFIENNPLEVGLILNIL